RAVVNFGRQVRAGELRDAPADPRSSRPREGHASAGPGGHGVSRGQQSDILNDPQRIFTGTNESGRPVDIYFRDGSCVITVAGDKTQVITSYGRVSRSRPRGQAEGTPVAPERWSDPSRWRNR